MDLVKAKLLRNGVNALHQAIHPLHGLAWTDGKQVILSSLHLQNEEPELGSSVVIGQFEHVHGLYWGPVTDIPALLAIQHKKHVTVWQLYYNPLEKNKLVVSQTCAYGEPLPILPQGCIWHPNKDILIVLTKRDIAVLYSACHSNNNAKADITGCSMIRCACWTKDGSRVVAAMDDSLYSYLWNDDNKTLSPCSFCPVFNIDSTIVAIQPTVDYQVVVTAEIATKSSANIHKELDESKVQMSLLKLDEELSRKNRRLSVDSGKSEPADFLKVSSLVPSDISQILARHRKSDPSPLLYMKQKSISVESKPELSNLVIVTFEKNATTTRKVSLPGISTPDILVLDSHCERAAVASNTSNLVLIYPIAPSCMPNIQQIKLEETERAKGVSFLTDTLLLIMTGRQRSGDMVFLPISISEKYTVQLLTRTIMPIEYMPSRLNCDQNIISDHCNTTAGNKLGCDQSVSKEFWMPNHIGSKSLRIKRKLREIARGTSCDPSPTSSLDDYDENKSSVESYSPVTLENFQTKPTSPRALKVNTGTMNKTFCRSVSQKPYKNDSEQTQEDSIPTSSAERTMIPGLEAQEVESDVSKSYKMLPYPSSEDPPYVSVTLQKSSDEGGSDSRLVLLCHGKLHLRTVREIFHVQTIEMMFDTKWVVLTEDGDGFAPVMFRPNQEIVIREAKDQWPHPLPGDTGSPEAWILSTSQFSPELLMMEMDFTCCWYQVPVIRIVPPGDERPAEDLQTFRREQAAETQMYPHFLSGEAIVSGTGMHCTGRDDPQDLRPLEQMGREAQGTGSPTARADNCCKIALQIKLCCYRKKENSRSICRINSLPQVTLAQSGHTYCNDIYREYIFEPNKGLPVKNQEQCSDKHRSFEILDDTVVWVEPRAAAQFSIKSSNLQGEEPYDSEYGIIEPYVIKYYTPTPTLLLPVLHTIKRLFACSLYDCVDKVERKQPLLLRRRQEDAAVRKTCGRENEQPIRRQCAAGDVSDREGTVRTVEVAQW
ncbi:PREDICTED: WD repeat and coiled-coil-containing protein-like [Nanorana parkeri]|uniref:WD repeat and coiled-coil-containing protein-like n=1 Tax=Nanorana parkeri TaxID=125878 RepID=UPI0008540A21|nr:PREDICTED: WD repeat and coiled-coil-containing protein-like [Nanorana parkeri]